MMEVFTHVHIPKKTRVASLLSSSGLDIEHERKDGGW